MSNEKKTNKKKTSEKESISNKILNKETAIKDIPTQNPVKQDSTTKEAPTKDIPTKDSTKIESPSKQIVQEEKKAKDLIPQTSILNDLDPVLHDSFSGKDVSQEVAFDLNNIENNPDNKVEVKNIAYAQSAPSPKASTSFSESFIDQVEVYASVQLGKAKLSLKELQSLAEGSLIELDRYVGEPVELVVNNKVIALGEVVSVDNKFGLKIKALED